jgi:hypothetical protein
MDSSNPRTFAGGDVTAAKPSAVSHSSFSRGLSIPSASSTLDAKKIPPESLGGVVDNPPACLSPEGEVSMGDTFNLSKLLAMSSDKARFVPGEAPNARVGCTSSSEAWGRGRFGTRTLIAECSLACVSRLGDPRTSRPDDPGASTPVSTFLPTHSPLLLTSTPKSHDMLALSTLSCIGNMAATARATPITGGRTTRCRPPAADEYDRGSELPTTFVSLLFDMFMGIHVYPVHVIIYLIIQVYVSAKYFGCLATSPIFL